MCGSGHGGSACSAASSRCSRRAAAVVFVAQVDVDGLGADHLGGDQQAFEEAVRVALQVGAVLEGAGLAFVDVHRHQARRGLVAHDAPLAPGRKAGAAQAAQAGVFHAPRSTVVGVVLAVDHGGRQAVAALRRGRRRSRRRLVFSSRVPVIALGGRPRGRICRRRRPGVAASRLASAPAPLPPWRSPRRAGRPRPPAPARSGRRRARRSRARRRAPAAPAGAAADRARRPARSSGRRTRARSARGAAASSCRISKWW